jgi:hypothetical protein
MGLGTSVKSDRAHVRRIGDGSADVVLDMRIGGKIDFDASVAAGTPSVDANLIKLSSCHL